MTTDPGPRFCPRCGTALVAGLSFCPGCGFNTAEIGRPSRSAATDRQASPIETPDPPVDADLWMGAAAGNSTTRDAPAVGSAPSTASRLFERRPPTRTIVIGAVLLAVGLLVFSQLMRPRPGGVLPTVPGSGGQQQPGPSSVGPALIVGLTIQSPTDGQQIATRDVTVIGIAPPGLSITRDVSLGLDQHATADGTGHWAMNVGLNEGENKLKFRIGDDRSTEQTLRVIYTPQTP
jgi:uncharacterized Zn finger protein (UPF0148 family)